MSLQHCSCLPYRLGIFPWEKPSHHSKTQNFLWNASKKASLCPIHILTPGEFKITARLDKELVDTGALWNFSFQFSTQTAVGLKEMAVLWMCAFWLGKYHLLPCRDQNERVYSPFLNPFPPIFMFGGNFLFNLVYACGFFRVQSLLAFLPHFASTRKQWLPLGCGMW